MNKFLFFFKRRPYGFFICILGVEIELNIVRLIRGVFLIIIRLFPSHRWQQKLKARGQMLAHKYNTSNPINNFFYCSENRATYPNHSIVQSHAKIYDASIQNESQFKEWIKQKSIAIVGNSPCEKSKGLGQEIDSHDIVIRMNNFETKNFETDYGTKCNVWVRSNADFNTVPLREVHSFNFTILTHDLNKWESNQDFSILCDFLQRSHHSFFMYREIIEELALKVNKNTHQWVSSGLVIVYYLFKIQGGLDNIDTYGFSFTDQIKDNQTTHYFSDKSSPQSALHNAIHQWDNEKIFFMHLQGVQH